MTTILSNRAKVKKKKQKNVTLALFGNQNE